jgi:rubrerythrin
MKKMINELLIEAMNSEKRAKEFYIQASSKAESGSGKKMFKELAEFEENHYERIKHIINSINEDNKMDIKEIQEISYVKSEIEGEIETNKNEISNIILTAIESEKEAQKRYLKIAELFEDDEGKQIFEGLANDERNHQRILEDQFYNISNKGLIIWE